MIIIQEQGMLPAQRGRDVLQVFMMILEDLEICAHYHNLTSFVDSTNFKHLDKTISLHDFSITFCTLKKGESGKYGFVGMRVISYLLEILFQCCIYILQSIHECGRENSTEWPFVENRTLQCRMDAEISFSPRKSKENWLV